MNITGYTNINDFRRVESVWPNNLKLSNKPYGFYVYASEGAGITTKYSFGHAYKKDFAAGDIVHIPSPGSVKYIPTYFIDWADDTPVTPPPAVESDDATIASVSYKANGVAATALAAADFAAGSTANEYVANVTLPITTTTLSEFVIAANDSNADVTDNPGTVTIGASEFAKTVTV